MWNDDDKPYSDARIIFLDTETSNWAYDEQSQSYYWHRFYNHQADLNFNSTAVRQEMKEIIDFWFKMGVDGMRISSVMFLYQKENTNCVNLPEVHRYIKKLRQYVDEQHPGKILLAPFVPRVANQ